MMMGALFKSFAALSLAAVIHAPALAQGRVIDSRSIYFGSGEEVMTQEAKYVLDAVVEAWKSEPRARVTITSHTDSTGSEEFNLRISTQRAQEAADYMISKGVSAGRIVVIGKGESEPMMPTGDNVAEPLNRRTNIEVIAP